jgi:two-component system, cell cycle response regulator DivK
MLEQERRALIVEDVPENRYLERFLLEMNGWKVTEVTDGESALALANELTSQTAPHVVLLDIGLPGGMSGYDLATKMRQMPQLRRSLLVAVTSYAMGGDEERARSSGCDGYISKPLNVDNFMEYIEQLLATRQPS